MKSLADRIVPPVPQGYSNQEDGYVVLWRGFLDWHKNLLANIAELELGAKRVNGNPERSNLWLEQHDGKYVAPGYTHTALLIDVQPIDAADQELRDRGYSEESIAAVKAGLESAKAGRIPKRAENFGTSSARIEESGKPRCEPNNVYSNIDNSDRCKQAAERLRELAVDNHKYDEGQMYLHLAEIADSLDPRPEPACEHAPSRSGNYGNGEPNNIWYEMRCYKCGAEIRPSSWASRTAETSKHRVETMPLTDEELAMLAEDEDASKKQPKNDASEARIESGHETRSDDDEPEENYRFRKALLTVWSDLGLGARWPIASVWSRVKKELKSQPGSDLAVPADEVEYALSCGHDMVLTDALDRIQASRRAGHPTGVK